MALFPRCCLTSWCFTDSNHTTSQPLLCWAKLAEHSVTPLVTQTLNSHDWLYNLFLHHPTRWSSLPQPCIQDALAVLHLAQKYLKFHLGVHLPFLTPASSQQLLEVNSLVQCTHFPVMSSQPAAPSACMTLPLYHCISSHQNHSSSFPSFRSFFQSFLILHQGGTVP